VLTVELIKSSNVEVLMTDALIRSTSLALDQVLFDANPEDTTRPAGLRYGLTALTASSAPETYDALVADVGALTTVVERVTPLAPMFVMSSAKALMTRLRSFTTLQNVYGSYAFHGTDTVIAVAPDALAVVVGAIPQISAKRSPVAVLGVEDQPLSTWQTDCVAIKLNWPLTWALRSPSGVAWLTTANW
jgi:hypothetical protein